MGLFASIFYYIVSFWYVVVYNLRFDISTDEEGRFHCLVHV